MSKCTFVDYLSRAKNDWSHDKYQHYIDQLVTNNVSSISSNFGYAGAHPRLEAISGLVATSSTPNISTMNNIHVNNHNNNNHNHNNNNNVGDNDNKANNVNSVNTIATSNINNGMNNTVNTFNVSNMPVIGPRIRLNRHRLDRAGMDRDSALLRLILKLYYLGSISACVHTISIIVSLVFIFVFIIDIDVESDSISIKPMSIYVSFYFTMIGFVILIDLLCFVGHLHIGSYNRIFVKVFKICLERIRREIDEIQAEERLTTNGNDNDNGNDDKPWTPSSQEIVDYFIKSNTSSVLIIGHGKYDFYSIRYNSTEVVEEQLKFQSICRAYQPSLPVRFHEATEF